MLSLDIQLRFNDTDALGHLNNTAYATYAELARVHFFRALDIVTGNLILAHLALDFKRQVHFGSSVQVETGVETIGRSSVTMQQRILADGELAATVRSVVVYFDYSTNRPIPVPEKARGVLEQHKA
jgi:acyl-CoA thioester hydrolase